MERTAVFVRIEGRVQGVGFRAWTLREARALGLAGWVRNEADGSVKARIEGRRESVDRMLERLRTGPPRRVGHTGPRRGLDAGRGGRRLPDRPLKGRSPRQSFL
jgi:acylphosphatase